MTADSATAQPDQWASRWLADGLDELIAIRRQLHAHPELSRAEFATTDLVVERLRAVGLDPVRLPGTGAYCDVGGAGPAPDVVLRADLDALPLQDEKDVPYRSTFPGVAHACGHDVHTTVVLGAGLVLADQAAREGLPGRVRLVFQPSEELMPGGALDVIAAGAVEGARSVFALHCDPSIEVGGVGLKVGPLTAASDQLTMHLTGPGGHTSRPQNTVDLVYALARVTADLPAALNRVIDPRAAMTLVWGMISAGSAANAIPRSGLARGTLRMLDQEAWEGAPEVVRRLAAQLAAPYGAEVQVDYVRGVPPVINDVSAIEMLTAAARAVLPAGAIVPAKQSLGGEDFGWYLAHAPGAMARLGVRRPGAPAYDLHQGSFDVDEGCIDVGVRLLVGTALEALRS
ncbi:MAG: hypothetical protein QOC98_2984 [Frankiaceae bacterium]|nr:hypothetical protein [Frankiaceae bacterium]